MQAQELDMESGPRLAPAIEAIHPNTSRYYIIIKRGFDVIASLLILIVLSPLLLVIMILIKIEAPHAKVIYKQLRAGKNGVPFYCYKFRSMIPQADEVKSQLMALNEMDGPVFKVKNDPRITKLGRVLRRCSLDELPQMLNILFNPMSLVGPRPLPVEEASKCDERAKLREQVKPGCVCYWQVSGRNDLSFEKWIDLDLQYVGEQSLWVDFKILLRTFRAVLSSKGAY
jgi:lipopolysaccharide/colanic/teichoic acid biosynthesis glycosyltransferase